MSVYSAARNLLAGTFALAFGAANAQQITVQQVGVTAANANGNAVYNLTVPTNPPSPLINGAQVLNTDGASHGSFTAVARVPNSVTSALDLIVADQTNHQIVRYPGPGPTSYKTATAIYNWTNSPGPKYPTALASDVAGNVYLASNGLPSNGKASLWVLPFNSTTGAYGAPILIDSNWGGAKCQSTGDLTVAATAATPVGNAAPAWGVGDLITMCNGSTSLARVWVYSKAALQSVLSTGTALSGPTSTLISSGQLQGVLPIGVDIWPADASHGVSLLITTNTGRVMRFDSGAGAFTTDFANGLGQGLLKVKVGTYATVTYAFVAQSTPGTGRIMQFGAPPAGGPNTTPLATLTTGVNNPLGLAATSSGSVPASACFAPGSCEPLGPQLQTQISGSTGGIPPSAQLLEESCVVQSDTRVKYNPNWSCDGTTLDIAKFCPGFPSTVLPGSMCGHSGPTGSGFVVVKSTAKTLDQNVNNNYLQSMVDPDQPLPGPHNLQCPQEQVFAWAPRSDLPTIEGTIPEDQALANTFIDLSGFCDTGGGTSHILSMIAYGLGLNTSSGMPTGQSGQNANGVPGFVNNKFLYLTATINGASAQISPTVQGQVQGYVTQAQSFFNTGVTNGDANSYGCAMNTLATADSYVRNAAQNIPGSFTGLAPPGNPNPAGDIDGRLENIFFTTDLYFLGAPPNREWPTNNVPPCMSFTASPTTVIAGNSATLTWSGAAPGSLPALQYPLSYTPAWCKITATDGTPPSGQQAGAGTASTGPLNTAGPYNATLTCSSVADNSNTINSLTVATVNVVTLKSITISPPNPTVAAGGTVSLTAQGNYSDGTTTQDLTSSATWISDSSAATVVAGVVSCNPNAGTQGTATITASSPGPSNTKVSGSTVVTCSAPSLTAITVTPSSATIAAGGSTTMTAAGTYSDSYVGDVTATASWTSSPAGVVTVAVNGSLATVSCVTTSSTGGTATITASSPGAGNTTISGTSSVTCSAPVLNAIQVTPSSVAIPAGSSQQLTATGTYSFGPTQTPSSVTWGSSNTSVATVSATGLVSCLATADGGSATITASAVNSANTTISGTASVTCQPSALTSITLAPSPPPEINYGGTLQLTATGNYADGATKPLTGTATWTSSNTNNATVSGGLVSCKATLSFVDTTATITVSSGSVSTSVLVTCEQFGGNGDGPG